MRTISPSILECFLPLTFGNFKKSKYTKINNLHFYSIPKKNKKKIQTCGFMGPITFIRLKCVHEPSRAKKKLEKITSEM
jgi:hypothetical protein